MRRGERCRPRATAGEQAVAPAHALHEHGYRIVSKGVAELVTKCVGRDCCRPWALSQHMRGQAQLRRALY